MNPVAAMGIALLMLLLNGLFVAAEFSLIAAKRTRIEALAAEGNRKAQSASKAMSNLPLTLSGAQLGITLTSLVLGLIAEPAVADVLERAIEPLVDIPKGLLHTISFAVALTVVVFLHMVIGEMVPKNLALAESERTALWVSPPHGLFVLLLRPVVWLLNGMASLLLKPFGVEQVDELGTAHTARELVTMIDASATEGLIAESHGELLSAALSFADIEAVELMIPWDRVITADRQATVADVSSLAAASGHSRLPVVSGASVHGFVHAKDLLHVDNGGRDRPMDRELIRRMLVVPPARRVSDLLLAMRRSQIHFALVRDGGDQLGIVTLEDILETIVGEIIDESDRIRGNEPIRN